MRRTALLCFLLLFSIAGLALAVKRIWQSQQLSELKDRLKTSSLDLDPDDLTKLTEHPMAAVSVLGVNIGCTAS